MREMSLDLLRNFLLLLRSEGRAAAGREAQAVLVLALLPFHAALDFPC
jgi:hypothetical protein